VRAVLDTVIFVRALINPKGRWGRQLFEEADNYTLVLSTEIVSEILDVIYRPEIRQRFPEMLEPPRMNRLLAIIEAAEVMYPTERIEVCRDPKDNKFFECAVAAGADYIVSEDADIVDVGEYRGVRTVSAAEFLELLGR
jgi:putative PIN family toxin of toxin-antitoxin system